MMISDLEFGYPDDLYRYDSSLNFGGAKAPIYMIKENVVP